jgi:flavodoxin
MKTLIACYSDTGNTLKVAEAVKAALGADLAKIGGRAGPE